MNRIKGLIGGKFPVKVFTLLMLASSAAYADDYVPHKPPGMSDGGCWADPMNDLIIKLDAASFTSNEAGATATIRYQTVPYYYPGWCYSTTTGSKSAGFYRGESDMTAAGQYSGYYKLSDDVDFFVEIEPDTSFVPLGQYVKVPFPEKLLGSFQGPFGAGVSKLENAHVANTGNINFKLRRTLIGGAFFIPGGVELLRLYRYVYMGKGSNIPIYRLITQQTIVPVPVECRINGGKTIDVDFGNIQVSLLTTSALSSAYQQPRQLQYKCNSKMTQDVKVNLVAENAPFGTDAIKTDNEDIGVVMLYNNKVVKPQGSYQTRLVDGMGSDNVSFAVVGSGTKPTRLGEFTGSATLIISSL